MAKRADNHCCSGCEARPYETALSPEQNNKALLWQPVRWVDARAYISTCAGDSISSIQHYHHALRQRNEIIPRTTIDDELDDAPISTEIAPRNGPRDQVSEPPPICRHATLR